MNLLWTSISFWMSLITNIVVYCGVLSFFYWIRGNMSDRFVMQHRHALEHAVVMGFLVYLYLESITNTYLSPHAFGMHWTFLNLIILLVFQFNAIMHSRIFLGFTLLANWGYLFADATHITASMAAWVIGLNIAQYLAYRFGDVIAHKLWLGTLFMMGFGVVSFATAYVITPIPFDLWFWVRQLGAWTILAIITCTYAHALAQRNRLTLADHTHAWRDPLTTLYNMGAFTKDLQNAFDHAQQVPYALIEIDIDWFKRVNDTYGHLVGNKVLQVVAQTLTQIADNAHQPAKVYRMGGEEFSVLLTGIHDQQIVSALAQKIHTQLASLNFEADDTTFGITASIGIAHVLPNDTKSLDIYARVDHSLYLAKHAGRNTIDYSVAQSSNQA